MNPQDAIDLGRQALVTTMIIGAPLLVTGLVVGLLIGLAQAVTQIQEQTVAFVPKLVAMVLVFMLTLPWLISQLTEYSQELFRNIPSNL